MEKVIPAAGLSDGNYSNNNNTSRIVNKSSHSLSFL